MQIPYIKVLLYICYFILSEKGKSENDSLLSFNKNTIHLDGIVFSD